jgi:DNA polymerase-3 subunit epsilon
MESLMGESWVAIDFETANSFRGSPCSVGMAAVEGGHIVDRFTTLIQPPEAYSHFEGFNIAIHGIRPEDVAGAPAWHEAYKAILDFADGRLLVAHNAAFDMGVLKQACIADDLLWPDLTYACTLVAARRTWRLLSYRLDHVAAAAGLEFTTHHEAMADAEAAAHIMLAALKIHETESVAGMIERLRIDHGSIRASGETSGCSYRGAPTRKAVPAAYPDADPTGPLFGCSVCITGTLSSMTRNEAYDLLAKAGAQPTANVSKKTDILVIGTQDPAQLRPGAARSGKHEKAEQVLAKGNDIELLDEVQFLERLGMR